METLQQVLEKVDPPGKFAASSSEDPSERLARFLVFLWSTADEKNRAKNIVLAWQLIPIPYLLEGEIAAARSLRSKAWQAYALARLSETFPYDYERQRPHPDGMLLSTEAFAVARNIEDAETRQWILNNLRARPDDEWRRSVEQNIVEALWINDIDLLAMALASLVPYVPEFLEKALALAQSASSDRGAVLAELVPQLPDNERGALWSKALEACGGTLYTTAVCTSLVISRLPAVPVGQALKIVRDIPREEVRMQALKSLASNVSDGQLTEALVRMYQRPSDPSCPATHWHQHGKRQNVHGLWRRWCRTFRCPSGMTP
jgi:hypothetical protein